MLVYGATGELMEFLRLKDVEGFELGVKVVEKGGKEGEEDGKGWKGAHCTVWKRSTVKEGQLKM